MLKLFIVLFRETLEISVILGIILAATTNIKNRSISIYTGIAIGILGAIIAAISTKYITNIFEGYGQEIINATVLLIAVLLIIWTIIWIKSHTKKVISKIRTTSSEVSTGDSSLISLSLIIAATIFREGTEIALFSYGILFTTPPHQIFTTILGGIAGFSVAAIIGFGIYKGIITASGKYLFRISTILLSLVAASMSSQAANLLVASEIINKFTTPLWNSSSIIPEGSILGIILNNLIGYTEQPSGIEIIFYLGTLIIIFIFSVFTKKLSHK